MIVFEKVPETIRVPLDQFGFQEGFVVLIVPNESKGRGFREFYLQHASCGTYAYMFGCTVADDAEAAQLVLNNAEQYAAFYVAEYFDDSADGDDDFACCYNCDCCEINGSCERQEHMDDEEE